MKKILLFIILVAAVSACSDSGSSSLIPQGGSVSVSKLTWEGVCTENNGTVNTAGECVADGEVLTPSEVCGFSGGILNGKECVYANAGSRPCGGRGQCIYDNATTPGQCIYDNVTGTPGCQFHENYCPLNPDGTPICSNDPDNCTAQKPACPQYRQGWKKEHGNMHGQGGMGGWHGGRQ